jgi:sulfur transfer complex TusBCD TusB component (DsrH family)
VGREAWRRKVALTCSFWSEIERLVAQLRLSYERVRLYQDGLPVCGREPEIVRQLAKTGSKNHQLLVRLMDLGARLMGTESAELLVQEYELVKQVFEAAGERESAAIEAERKHLGDLILKQRDEFIAGRINSTLLPNETGILFLGLLHSLENWLDGDKIGRASCRERVS